MFFVICAEDDRSALFFASNFSVFLKNPKKMTSFLKKSAYFLKKNATFFFDFPVFVALQRIQS